MEKREPDGLASIIVGRSWAGWQGSDGRLRYPAWCGVSPRSALFRRLPRRNSRESGAQLPSKDRANPRRTGLQPSITLAAQASPVRPSLRCGRSEAPGRASDSPASRWPSSVAAPVWARLRASGGERSWCLHPPPPAKPASRSAPPCQYKDKSPSTKWRGLAETQVRGIARATYAESRNIRNVVSSEARR